MLHIVVTHVGSGILDEKSVRLASSSAARIAQFHVNDSFLQVISRILTDGKEQRSFRDQARQAVSLTRISPTDASHRIQSTDFWRG